MIIHRIDSATDLFQPNKWKTMARQSAAMFVITLVVIPLVTRSAAEVAVRGVILNSE